MADSAIQPYIGRFAPSPTGPLHFGSLVAALASFLDARNANGTWLVRIEDIDPPREEPGASDAILSALDSHGLNWDDQVIYQSQNLERYGDVINDLSREGYTFKCTCSRQTLRDNLVYPGICRDGVSEPGAPTAIRLRAQVTDIQFDDLVQGTQQVALADAVGDFVVRRKDQLIAYQLAVAVDDLDQKITRVVRGIDLLDSSFKQIYIMQLMKLPPPTYAHIPVITDSQGTKLSKQNLAPPLDCDNPLDNLYAALIALGQHPPADLCNADLASVLSWGVKNWRLDSVPKLPGITEDKVKA